MFWLFAFFTSANERCNKMRGLEPRTRRPDSTHDIAAVFSSPLPQSKEHTSCSCLACGPGERSWIRNGSSRTVPTRCALPLHLLPSPPTASPAPLLFFSLILFVSVPVLTARLLFPSSHRTNVSRHLIQL